MVLIKSSRISVIRGPNYWSSRHHRLIVLSLSFRTSDTDELSSAKFILQTVTELFPQSHGRIEELFARLDLNRDAREFRASLVKIIAQDLQKEPSAANSWSSIEKENSGYRIIFEYADPEAGALAAEAAVYATQAILENKIPEIKNTREAIQMTLEKNRIDLGTTDILKAASRFGIPYRKLNDLNVFVLGTGKYMKRIQTNVTENTSLLAADLARDKDRTKKFLSVAHLPVPRGTIVAEGYNPDQVINSLGFPLVVKPAQGHKGNGVTTNINSLTELDAAVKRALNFFSQVIIEQFITGNDHRMLVIGYKFIAAVERIPAYITGDGSSSIQQLIDKVNRDPERGNGQTKVLTRIAIDEATLKILAANKVSLATVLKKDEILRLKYTANISTGGIAKDVTNEVHSENKRIAEEISRRIGLDICGIDVIAPDLKTPLKKSGGAVLEVNAAPGIRMHIAPTIGTPRKIGEAIVQHLFPAGQPSRIPLVAITGTTGKTETARLLARMARACGYKVGMTSSDGIYADAVRIAEGEFTDADSAELLLTDPQLEFAVLECSNSGILKTGLGFETCDVGVVLNAGGDRRASDYISIKETAKLLAVVPQTILPAGFAVLNADDPLAVKLSEGLSCRIALFSLGAGNEEIKKHMRSGGLSCYLAAEKIIITEQGETMIIADLKKIPFILKGKTKFVIRNVMAALLAAKASGLNMQKVKNELAQQPIGWRNTPQHASGTI
jgi:cyanophycin synthetase